MWFLNVICTLICRLKTKLEEENHDDAVTFKKGAESFVKEVFGELKEYQFFLGMFHASYKINIYLHLCKSWLLHGFSGW